MVSVIIPTYNREKLIARSVESVLSQTYSDLECIVVDDNSTDNTQQVVEAINDPRVRYVKLPEGKGANPARNYGVSIAKGEWIAFQDSDDVWMEKKLEKQLSLLTLHQADIIACPYVSIQGERLPFCAHLEQSKQLVFLDLFPGNLVSTQTMLGKRDCFLACPFDNSFPRLQDWELAIRLVTRYKIYLDLEPLVCIEQQGERISSNNKYYVEAISMLFDKVAEMPLPQEQKNEALSRLFKAYVPFWEENQNLCTMLQEKSEQAEAIIQENREALCKLEDDYRKNREALCKLEDDYRCLENAYNTIINSQTYRMTAPVRIVLDKLKRTRWGSMLFRIGACLKNLSVRISTRKFCGYVREKLKFDAQPNLLLLLRKTWCSVRTEGIRATLRRISIYKRKSRKKPQKPKKLKKICTIAGFLDACVESGGEVFHADELRNTEKDVVLLVSHELNLTGAPVAVEYFALCLKKMGEHPVVLAPHDDILRQRICEDDIPVVTLPEVYCSNVVPSSAHLFKYIVVCTNVGAPLVAQLNGMAVPVVWWIHEARASYSPAAVEAMPEILEPNIHVYCGGAYAQRLLQEYRPKYTSRILLYYVEDYAKHADKEIRYQLEGAEGKTVFAIVGMQEYRKGQDILIEAIHRLPPERLKESFFVFVGRECYPPIQKMISDLVQEYPQNTLYVPELNKEDLLDMYLRMDCLVCSSRDDPMPIVVADAMALSKLVICSEHTGYGQLLEEMGGGLLYRRDDPNELMGCLMYVLEHKGDMQKMQSLARATYDRYFSFDQFANHVSDIIYNIKNMNHSIAEFCNLFAVKKYGGEQKIFLKEQLCEFDNNGKRSILLISHELSLTGAPVVLKDLAHVLREQGNNVAVMSPFDGAMREVFVKDGFPVILFENVYVPENQNEFLQFAECFQLIVPNTVVTFRIIPYLGTINVPVLWWIHDGREAYHEGGFGNILPAEIPTNVRILCGGGYAKKQLLDHYPQYQAEELLYGVEDVATLEVDASHRIRVKEPDKFLFICVGTIENRKGQDILVDAIYRLSGKERERCKFLFIGKALNEEIKSSITALVEEMPDVVSYISQVSREEIRWIYQDSDCLICCSRDDPMPVVVTEMQSLSKMVICSENTGSASLLRETHGGLVYENNSPEALAEKIQYVLNIDNDAKAEICKRARKTYEQYFSKNVFRDKVSREVERMCSEEYRVAHTGVSVVIPFYNAGAQCEVLIQKLNGQKGIGNLEIIGVDSGSTDGTQEICRSYGCSVIQISQSEFTHSYARRLGAEHASGSVIIFMTQDALPDGDEWAEKMIRPIVTREAAAVSCREACPDTTDLYYRVASWNNARWLGIQKQDRIGQYYPNMSEEDLRINAALNDVACAVDRSIFFRFGYRFGYAEDLDLGVRLIKSGYRIKLLNNPTVLHGHSRNAWYYLKRGFVETLALKDILYNPGQTFSAKEIAEGLMPGYIAVHNTLSLIRDDEFKSVKEFLQKFQMILKEQIVVKQTKMMEGWNEEKEIEKFLNSLVSVAGKIGMNDMTLAYRLSHYLETVLVPFLNENGWIESGLSYAMCECIYKQMALIVGCYTADLNPEEEIFETVQKYTQGV